MKIYVNSSSVLVKAAPEAKWTEWVSKEPSKVSSQRKTDFLGPSLTHSSNSSCSIHTLSPFFPDGLWLLSEAFAYAPALLKRSQPMIFFSVFFIAPLTEPLTLTILASQLASTEGRREGFDHSGSIVWLEAINTNSRRRPDQRDAGTQKAVKE